MILKNKLNLAIIFISIETRIQKCRWKFTSPSIGVTDLYTKLNMHKNFVFCKVKGEGGGYMHGTPLEFIYLI